MLCARARPDRAHVRACAGLAAHTLVLKAQGFAVDEAHARIRLQVGGRPSPRPAWRARKPVAQVCADLLEQLDQNMFADISGLPAAHRNLYMTVRARA